MAFILLDSSQSTIVADKLDLDRGEGDKIQTFSTSSLGSQPNLSNRIIYVG